MVVALPIGERPYVMPSNNGTWRVARWGRLGYMAEYDRVVGRRFSQAKAHGLRRTGPLAWAEYHGLSFTSRGAWVVVNEEWMTPAQ